MERQTHILVVDDDERLRDLLSDYLSAHSFLVTVASSALEARKLQEYMVFDVMILDVMMPGETGMEYLQDFRKQNTTTPVLMLTAMGESQDRIKGLTIGADDYLAKPFEPQELLLRLRNLLKRSEISNKSTVLRFGAFTYDILKDELKHHDEVIHLTTSERQFLRFFGQNPNRLISRDELLACLGDTDNERAVDVQVTRLRKKIEQDQKHPIYLQTIRGKGYIFKV